MIIRGQLHDNSCKKNGLNNSVPSVFSVLKISSARTKKLRNLKTYKPKNLITYKLNRNKTRYIN